MATIKKIFTNWRVILLLTFLLFAVVAIHPKFDAEGVAIRSVFLDSAAKEAGFVGPEKGESPVNREVITSINNIPISSSEDYFNTVSQFEVNQTITISTTRNVYVLTVQPEIQTIVLSELEEQTIYELTEVEENGTIFNKTVERTELVNKTITKHIGVEDIGLIIYDAPTTNIRKGLDLEGGTRVLLRPEHKISETNLTLVVDGIKQRVDVYGLSDIVVREATDLSGNQYILVEVAGINEQKVKELITTQGKFEAKIGENIVFIGGKDITYVCRTPDCSGFDPATPCQQDSSGQWFCGFRFQISLSPEAAKKHAELTGNLAVVGEPPNRYLSEQLILYLDDRDVNRLNIGESLKGRTETDIQISGSGQGVTFEAAQAATMDELLNLQTVLATGSLPVKLEIVKTDNISPALGEQFVRNAMLTGLVAILGVAAVVFIRYRKLKIVIPMIFTSLSEVVLLLGMAALINWNLDLSAIAGIIIAVGTGVDHQIVITEEVVGKQHQYGNMKDQFKKAFFIIMIAYATTMVAMIPLLFAGAGLIKGFAITTMLGVSFGVFVTRPAFASIIQILLKD